MRDPVTGKRLHPQTGREMQVGTDTVRSSHASNIFKKAPVKAELAVEVMAPTEGRKIRAFWGREEDGSWRGRVQDIGHVNENSPYAYIRVMDDEEVNLRDVEEITEGMANSYESAIDRDRREWDESDLYEVLNNRLQELGYNLSEMKKDFAAGMKLFFGDNWQTVARQLFPQGEPRL